MWLHIILIGVGAGDDIKCGHHTMEIIIVNFTLGLVSDLGEQRSDQHKTGQNSIYFFFNTDVTTTHSEERLEYSGFLFQICSANIRIV